jgi:hypothetical protein
MLLARRKERMNGAAQEEEDGVQSKCIRVTRPNSVEIRNYQRDTASELSINSHASTSGFVVQGSRSTTQSFQRHLQMISPG